MSFDSRQPVLNATRFAVFHMRLLDRYIFVEWLKTFVLAVAATLGVLLLEDFQDDGPDFFSWGASTHQILTYYAYLIPSFLPTIIPVSLLISARFMLGNLHRNNEITAMRASGLGILQITRPLWLAGALLSLAMFYLNAEAVPNSIEVTRTIRDNLRMSHEAERIEARDVGVVPLLGFDNQAAGRLWFMNRFSDFTNDGFAITVYQRDPAGRETSRVIAREGYFDETLGYWIFIDGREISFDPLSGEPVRSLPFDEQAYPSFREHPVLMKTLNKQSEDLSFFELQTLLASIPPEDNPKMRGYAVRYHAILANPFSCLVVIGIVIPFAVSGVRINPLVGVAKTGFLFLIYFMMAAFFQLLGERGTLSVELAAWLPVALGLIASAILLRLAR